MFFFLDISPDPFFAFLSHPIHHVYSMDDTEFKQFLTRLHDALEDLDDLQTYKPPGYIRKAARATDALYVEILELYEQKGYSMEDLKHLSKSPETRSKLIRERKKSGFKKSTGNEQN